MEGNSIKSFENSACDKDNLWFFSNITPTFNAKIGVTWTLVSEILGHQNHFYLDTKIGRHLDTFLDTPMKKIILS